MRRVAILLVLSISCLLAAADVELQFEADLVSLDSLFSDTALVRVDTALCISKEFSLRLPLTLVGQRTSGGVLFFQAALMFDYHPFGWPMYLSLSLLQAGFVFNHPYESETQVLYLQEMALGWQIRTFSPFLIDVNVVIKDPNRLYTQEYNDLGSLFTRFPMVRLAVLAGWSFPVRLPAQQHGENL